MSEPTKKQPKHEHAGHRSRLRERFLEAPGALPDYEILEMMLFAANPRGDTKAQAKKLLAEFGGFAKLINADLARLRASPHAGEAAVAAIKMVREAAIRLVRAEVQDRPILSGWQALLDYLQVAMGESTIEQFRILFLDRKNVLIADEVQQQGTVDQTPVYPREVVKRALELGASAIIMVHNHPTWPFRSRSITPHHLETQRLLGLS